MPVLIVLCAGCAARRPVVARGFPPEDVPPQAIVFVADGAGGTRSTSDAFRVALKERGLPWMVERLEWTHGTRRYLADHVDYDNAGYAGRCLAQSILGYRQQHPDQPIFVVGHSAGTTVVVEAMKCLPPDTVNQVLLMAPTLSASYDIRPTLRASRCGVDVFCSRRDWVNVGVSFVGTADRRWFEGVAGRNGFHSSPACPGDACLFVRLRHHPWTPEECRVGRDAGHYGSYRKPYLNAVVLPMMMNAACPPVRPTIMPTQACYR